MVEIMLVRLSDDLSFNSELLKYISYARRVRINNYINVLDKKRSLISELLIKKISYEKLNIPMNEIRISYNPYGKPYLDNIRFFKFNISHSCNYVVIAVSKNRIGIDIEKIKKKDMAIAKRFFTNNEYKYILSQATENDKAIAFYKIWTLKESYVKAVGKGLKIPLNSFEFTMEDEVNLNRQKGSDKYHFYTKKINDYILSLCFSELDINYEFTYLNEDELYQYYRKD